MTPEKCKLKVIFSGVSTHFRNGIVAGIPHRVVLPDASHFFTDFLSIDGHPGPFLYYLNPHFARLDAGPDISEISTRVDLTIRGLITNGYIQSGVRLQVGNGIPQGDLRTLPPPEFDPTLNSYDPKFEYSADVVVGGRAACYFDFEYGTALWHPPAPPQKPAWTFSIELETYGYPWLLVTPLNPPATPDVPPFMKLELGRSPYVELQVSNVEVRREESADQGSGRFDFLLNFLTSRGGIPHHIVKTTPGLENPSSATAPEIAAALRHLASLLPLKGNNPAAFYAQLHDAPTYGESPACSPSQFG